MKQVRFLHQMLVAMVMTLALGSCSSDELSGMEPSNQNGKHTMQMEFVGGVVGFDQQNSAKNNVQTRATTSSPWLDGDKIYITFYNGSEIVPGEATYDYSSGWTVSYYGNLATGSSQKCEVRFFNIGNFSNSSVVFLNSNTDIYEDSNATYAFSNGSLTVSATLFPKTGRIRFTGKSGEKIHTTGITYYTSFSPSTNTFSTSNTMITSTVGLSGSTPFIYGYFSDSDRRLGLVGSDYAFTRIGTSSMFNAGESGYMAIPSESSHNNWRSGLYVKANGVEFKMIPVAGYSGGFFMMAETETTEALYKSINGLSSTSQLPISSISYENVISFIEKLNMVSNLNFSLPSAEQWEYAAKGGNKTKGYTYAGSNSIENVAWYKANCSSAQNVKTKAPNELGIYDMSGNVEEFLLGKDGNYYYCCGGCHYSSASECTTNSKSRIYYSNSSFAVGFRLILTLE